MPTITIKLTEKELDALRGVTDRAEVDLDEWDRHSDDSTEDKASIRAGQREVKTVRRLAKRMGKALKK